ncbi:HNH endonuclease [Microvirga tunisiensis]|uniref:HNH endonuclease n=2 Tax=Microvirga tunisiensis TaxID=2108360 RepID=A0A5N7MCQ1_9HYPH|nr:HNH endonuclease [Microvirga tunisiensis]MPR24625.1 HNH endonuclease [Microvirga tunisiensis]
MDQPRRNPSWSRDELILALDLYMRNPSSPPGKSSDEVLSLSSLLNTLGRLNAGHGQEYRNPNGVYMKMMNFRRFDPLFTAAGKVGLTRGGREEEAVWHEFAHDQERLAQVAQAIRTAAESNMEGASQTSGDGDGAEAEEGRILTRLHRFRERRPELVAQKKASVLAASGRLSCEVCNFDFEEKYGERGRGFIEAHHLKPLHTLSEATKTSLGDLALLCANCHRMIHSAQPWLSPDELRQILRND